MNARDIIHREVLAQSLDSVRRRASQLFFWLLIAQWVLAVGLALWISPYSWDGASKSVHVHVLTAFFLGALVNAVPLVLLRLRPHWTVTRHSVAVVQMLWSGILIHITGGRIETHFHVFASLAFIALFIDWRLIVTATLVVCADHIVRGVLAPESVYGVDNPEWWRFFEHAAWVVLEDIVLVLACVRAVGERRLLADRETALALLNTDIERQVELRTVQLADAVGSLGREMEARLKMEAELRQAQKLESVGRLASGVAHEINTPVQFVSDSVHFVQEAMEGLFAVVDKLDVAKRSLIDGAPSRDAALEAMALAEEEDLPYLRKNVPLALDRALEGLGRVATIVRSMKEFARADQREMTSFDLNQALQSTLTIASTEYKHVADLETHFGDVPPVLGFAGDLNQAFLNLIVNAAHAIGDVVAGTDKKGRITISTRVDGDDVVVSIGDTGGGIPPAIAARVFDPFFTTKAVGKGTGQGLAIARGVIVDKHRGQLTFDSQPTGTTFEVRLPLELKRTRALAA